jgi:cobyrinic acid a,c-diamide synthase
MYRTQRASSSRTRTTSACRNFISCADGSVAVIEGNRGLFDGVDAQGSHSTARLAKLLHCPVILVIDATKVTRTIAALVAGCRALDQELELAAVVLNRIGTARQEAVIREAVETATGVPVLGAIPKLPHQHLPSRHLGLVTAIEHHQTEAALSRVAEVIAQQVDVSAVLDTARRAAPLAPPPQPPAPQLAGSAASTSGLRVGVLKDRAFSFYYPENLEALQAAGAQLVALSPLADDLPEEVDALYAGGGFPEVYAAELSANRSFREQLAARIAEGLPVWAECGGLAYLSEAIVSHGSSYPMVGALPVAVELTARPQGHGYVRAHFDRPNPFLPVGSELLGHEFHYTRLTATSSADLPTVLSLGRGVGLGDGRDGMLTQSALATYVHVHALGHTAWAKSVVAAAQSGRPPHLDASTPSPRKLRVMQGPRAPSTNRTPAPRQRFERASLRQAGQQREAELRAAAAGLRSSPARRTRGRLGQQVRAAVQAGHVDALEQLVAQESGAVRHLVALTYQPDAAQRRIAAQGVGLAGRYHPRLVQSVIRRLVWAMNDESGTNAATAPEVLQAIAEHEPALLLPMVPDLCRLAADPTLHEGLAATLRTVTSRCPGSVGHSLEESLRQRAEDGGSCGIERNR